MDAAVLYGANAEKRLRERTRYDRIPVKGWCVPMSNLNDYVTHGELNELVSAIGEMFERSENRMIAFIENGVQKQVTLMAEQQAHMMERHNAMEAQLGTLTEDMQEVKTCLDNVEQRLSSVEKDVKELKADMIEMKADMKEVKAAVAEHDDEIITLRRVK